MVPLYAFSSYPDGGLISSVEDLSRYLMEMMRGYKGESKLLRRESFQTMMSGTANYGIFWYLREDTIGHEGGDPGIRTSMFFNPSTDVGFVVFTNYLMEDAASYKTFTDIQEILTEFGVRHL